MARIPELVDRQAALRLLACVYPKLRTRLIELAPFAEGDSNKTCENRQKLLAKISELSVNANFDRALGYDHRRLWFEIWSHPLYANNRSDAGTKLISRIVQSGQFDDPFQLATHPDFEIAVIKKENEPDKRWPRAMTDRVEDAFIGPMSKMLIAGEEDRDPAIVTVAAPRAYRILWLARWYTRVLNPKQPLRSLIGPYCPNPDDDGHTAVENVWPVVQRLEEHMGRVTALHTMADLGFPVVKPDIWLIRMSAQAGLFPDLAKLPDEKSVDRVRGSKRRMKNLISFFLDLAKLVDPLTPGANVLREIDFVLAKYGMSPEPDIGLMRAPERICSVQDAVKECEIELDSRADERIC